MDKLLEQLKEKIFSKFHKDSWEIKTLGEIATDIYVGREVRREDLGTGDHPAIKCGDINSQLPLCFEKCISFLDPSLVKKPKYFEHGDLLISKLSNKSSTVGTVRAYLGKEKCLLGDAVYALKHNQNPKYLAYVLSTENARNQIKNLLRESTVFHIYPKDIKQIKIPLPSLEIQQKIIEFLDRYIELERELERRKLQYEYYRELLFNRGIKEQKWPINSLGEVGTSFLTGKGVTKEQLDGGDFPAIKAGDVNSGLSMQFEKCCSYVNHDSIKNPKYFTKNDILFSGLGSENTKGKICVYLGDEKCILGECVISMSHSQNPKYLTYALSFDFCRNQLKEKSTQNQIFRLHTSKIKQIQIPLPPLDVQNGVVEILDKLYRIVHDFKEGIPFLIQKNREQYEFYRELLLEK